jgi:hypothetical protein
MPYNGYVGFPAEIELQIYAERVLPPVESYALVNRDHLGWRLEFDLAEALRVSGRVAHYHPDSAYRGCVIEPYEQDLDGALLFAKVDTPDQLGGIEVLRDLSLDQLLSVAKALEVDRARIPLSMDDFQDEQYNQVLHELLRGTAGLYSAVNIGQHLQETFSALHAIELAGRWPEIEKRLKEVPTGLLKKHRAMDQRFGDSRFYSLQRLKHDLKREVPGRSKFTQAAFTLAATGLIGIYDSVVTAYSYTRSRSELIDELQESAEHCARVRAPGFGWRIAPLLEGWCQKDSK